jgi:hypothetical protein
LKLPKKNVGTLRGENYCDNKDDSLSFSYKLFMKTVILILSFLLIQDVIAQDSAKVILTHMSVDFGSEFIFHGNQTNNHFSNTVKDQSFLSHLDSGLTINGNNSLYDFFSYGINVGFKKTQSKFRYVVGISLDRRSDRKYIYSKYETFAVDTIVQTSFSSSNSDTLYVDSSTTDKLTYQLRSQHFFAKFEALYDIKTFCGLKFSSGLGVMIGASTSSRASSRYTRTHQLFYNDSLGFPVYESEVVPANYIYFNSPVSTQGVSPTNYSEVNGRVTIKPYVPILLELGLGTNRFFSHTALSYSAKIGAEFQIVLHDGINARLFHSHHFGLVYKI